MTATSGCCVVGAGPAGAVLSLLLARAGVPVTLFEAHRDFDRDFRGDTLHPSVLEILDQLGLAERLLALPHTRLERLQALQVGSERPFIDLDMRRLKTRFPFIVLMPQARFLEFLVAEASRSPCFSLRLGSAVHELVEEQGRIVGVRHRASNAVADEGLDEARARLVIAADGRFSRVRRLAHLEEKRRSAPQDILWLRLPRAHDDPAAPLASFGMGYVMLLLDRGDHWQIGFVIAKGEARRVREDKLVALAAALGEVYPRLAARLDPAGAAEIGVLSVHASRVSPWYRDGLLLIGDAAHVMSPIGGVGINYAIQDAVVAANLLWRPLREGARIDPRLLRRVERRRRLPTMVVQRMQDMLQRRVVAAALAGRPARLPWPGRVMMRLPLVRSLAARAMAFGLRRVRVDPELASAT